MEAMFEKEGYCILKSRIITGLHFILDSKRRHRAQVSPRNISSSYLSKTVFWSRNKQLCRNVKKMREWFLAKPYESIFDNCKPVRVDVAIPTLDPLEVNASLLATLKKAEWVNQIIFGTEKPLSIARANLVKKASTEWIAMFDDDVSIPQDWFEILSRYVDRNVVGVSSPDMNMDIHTRALKNVVEALWGMHRLNTPYIDNCLVRKNAFLDYNPPRCFNLEDEYFYAHAKKKGKWVHVPYFGVKHYARQKSFFMGGVGTRASRLVSPVQVLKRLIVSSVLAWYAVLYSHSLRTVFYWYKGNVEKIAGWLMYGSFKDRVEQSA